MNEREKEIKKERKKERKVERKIVYFFKYSKYTNS